MELERNTQGNEQDGIWCKCRFRWKLVVSGGILLFSLETCDLSKRIAQCQTTRALGKTIVCQTRLYKTTVVGLLAIQGNSIGHYRLGMCTKWRSKRFFCSRKSTRIHYGSSFFEHHHDCCSYCNWHKPCKMSQLVLGNLVEVKSTPGTGAASASG